MTQKPEELTQVIVTVMEVYREEGTAGRMGDNSCKPGKIVTSVKRLLLNFRRSLILMFM